MDVEIAIDGNAIALESFVIPSMSLSSARADMMKKEFVLRINTKELIDTMNADYHEWVEESKKDDEQCGSPQDELAEAGYPPLEELLHAPDLVDLALGDYLARKLFEKFLPPFDKEKAEYWFDDEIDSSYNEGAYTYFRGLCYQRKNTTGRPATRGTR